ADDFATHVDQRTAGVSGVNGRVRLDERLELPGRIDIAATSGNDSSRHGVLESEGAAHGQHPVAYAHGVRITQSGGDKRLLLGRLNLDYSQIGFAVDADDFCVVLDAHRIILEPHANPVCTIHNVEIRDDIAIGIEDDA